MHMNQQTNIGFTGRNAELHHTQNETPIATLSVATKESWKNDQGGWRSRTEWHRAVALGKIADYAKTLPQGLARVGAGLPAALVNTTARASRIASSNCVPSPSVNSIARFAATNPMPVPMTRKSSCGSPLRNRTPAASNVPEFACI